MKIVISSIMLLIGLLSTVVTTAATWNGYLVTNIRPGGDRPCTMFQLAGVPVSDPAVSSTSPWFAIESTTPQYNQMVATLLAAKATGQPVSVVTTGTASTDCGGQPIVWVVNWP